MSSHNALIGSIVGSKILQVRYLVYLFENTASTVIAVEIRFANNAWITVQCDSDGESIKLAQDTFEKVDLDGYGRVDVVDVTQLDPASLLSCLGVSVERVTIEISDAKLKSLQIEGGDRKAFFSNVGDTLDFDENSFRQMTSEEGWAALTRVSYPLQTPSQG